MRHLASIGVCPILLMDTNLQGSLKMISRICMCYVTPRISYMTKHRRMRQHSSSARVHKWLTAWCASVLPVFWEPCWKNTTVQESDLYGPPRFTYDPTRILGQPGYLTQRSIPDIILKILYQSLRNYRGGTELLPFDLLQSKPIFCIQRVMNGGGILPFPCLRPTIAEYNPWSIMIWVHLKISAGHHDDRNESGALGDLSGMPSAADLRGIPSVA